MLGTIGAVGLFSRDPIEKLERKLWSIADRLRTLRAELPVLDEQLCQLRDEADDADLRGLMGDHSPGYESRQPRAHVEAMEKHRRAVVDEITELERRQDELLDQLSALRAG
jgi:predicted  nucleic acid-binding Zn-ribbon protein